MKWENIALSLFAIAAIIVIGFIFGNSLQFSEESHERSEQISGYVQKVIHPDYVNKKSEEWDIFVRKSAHVIEFAALGICVAGLVFCFFKKKQRFHICAVLLCVLSVAVLDEFIQSFTGRSSLVSDILVDFTGGCCGMGIMFLLYLLLNAITQNIHAHKQLK